MDNINTHRYCVIMCGGVGSRFWPYSRADRPKQFLDLLGTGRTLLQMSFDRTAGVIDPKNVVIVTNEAYRDLVREQLPEVLPENILAEPARRNTAPCIAWAALHIAALDPEASIIVAPSDHLITRENEFEQSVVRGFEFVEHNDALLTLGIKPSRPETGYGYIQTGAQASPGIRHVKTFTEKPSLDLAKVFVESGEFYWNSGIFLWRASTILAALRQYAPDLMSVFDRGLDTFGTAAETEFIDSAFAGCVNISIDYAVMEKATNVYVETVAFGWSDLGTWSALHDNSPRNRDGNVAQGCELLAYDSHNNVFAVSGRKLIVVDGLSDYIVADAGDVLLVCPLAHEQEIKQMVADAKIRFGEKYL